MSFKLNLKLKTPTPSADAPVTNPPPPPSATNPTAGKLKLSLKRGPSVAVPPTPGDAHSTEPPKPKRKYTKKPKGEDGSQPKPKKRLREEGDDETPAPKRKPKPTPKSLAYAHDEDDDMLPEPVSIPQRAPRPVPARTQSMKLSFKPKGPSLQKGIPLLKVKGAGKPPVRPPGVGYDSEAEEAEVDPAIESQFVLRMTPGDDCDLLRKAIEEKTIGKTAASGGPGVIFRFFDREGRRAMITIQGRCYAASMVELPCVIESMKSWNKKDWVKTADICQMLLVLGRVKDEEEAKRFPLPREINNAAHQYPHGLTPPMHWARKRRFRPRISYHRIEQVEEETELQLEADRAADRSTYDIIDADRSDSSSDSSDDDAEGEDEDMYNNGQQYAEFGAQTPAEDIIDASDLEAMLAEGLLDEEDEADAQGEGDADAEGEVVADGENLDDLFGDSVVEPETPATAHAVAMHAIGEASNVGTETAASTPNPETESPDADDDDDDGDSDDDEEVDEEAAARAQQIEDIRAEIRELDQNIADFVAQKETKANIILKERIQAKIVKQQADREVNIGKLRALGVEDE
ncbi:hypothetical protein K504DRAFT_506184 [Pleomassaria siparia CBS 279.74]|uniref:TAFII55 protein conserved region domain-containing protein n=1 Tax=Pleomassaria siparia CBS 279.74 TaxID=1314801 RepID=A0A6G1JXG6_9PLEO|nr:hypothetical protein K504DRAFT_506184 [Pleomassaria siparia CBS 279.74]